MKIGIISDLHGNYDAFESVLKEAKVKGIEHFLVLGDIVGYYYYPNKIVSELKKWNHTIIKGNHEIILEKLYNGEIDSVKLREKYGSGHEIALEKFSENELNELFNLPTNQKVVIDGIRFSLNHGTPWSVDSYLYPDSSYELFKECNENGTDFVLVGHSHYSFCVNTQNSMIINPGSVGQSREKGGVAFWCMVETKSKMVQFIQTQYNVTNLLKEIKIKDPKVSYLTNILVR